MAAPDRTRTAVLAVAVVVALLALGGLTVLLLGGDDDQLASTTPTASPTPSAPSPAPPPTPSAAATPEAATWEVSAAFVAPEAASAAEEPGWAVSMADAEPGPLLDPCGDGDFPLPDAVASDEQALESEREAGGSNLAQEVFRYETEQDAAAAFAAYLERVQRCPGAPVEGTSDVVESTVVEDASGEDRVLVREQYCNPACTDLYTTYSLVVRSADGLSVLAYSIGEDGDPIDGVRPLLDAAAEALQAAVTG